MRRWWVMAWKEVKLAFRDVGAIVSMLVTPIVLTVVMGVAFGGSNGVPISDIPVLVLDQDQGVFSEQLVSFFAADAVSDLVAPEVVADEAAARARVDADEVAALVTIPADFSDRIFPLRAAVAQRAGVDLLSLTPNADLSPEQRTAVAQAFVETRQASPEPAIVEIYASPDWRVSSSIVKSIVQQGLEAMNMQVQGTMVIMSQLVTAQIGTGMGSEEGANLSGIQDALSMHAEAESDQVGADLPIGLEVVSGSGRSFDWMSYSAASMAVLFLMLAVTSGGRTLLAERDYGTLPRLLISPIPALTVLLGKMAGVALTGLLQVTILWGATSLAGAYWGSVPAVLISLILLVLCASSVGAMISAWSRTPGQASAIGTAVTLAGAAISGTFMPRAGMPAWTQTVSLVTPNAWGIEIFSQLQAGKTLDAILPLLGGTLLVTVVYYALAMIGFRRQFS